VFTFSPAISFVVDCATQEEVDRLWDRLSAGGEPQPCGWLRDKYGVTWQIVPAVLGKLLSDPDAARAQRVMQVMLQMNKLDIGALNQAAGA
jgi:predicted 3-demethylubiquinone-9 3-methyltransferase (glyoxalase superfamily)